MSGVQVDLKIDRNKLNSNFDGYKLTLDSLPLYKLLCDTKPEDIQLSDSQYSYQHVKSFGVHNVLYADPWINKVVYFIDERWKVMKFTLSGESSLEQPKSVLQIPDVAMNKSVSGRVAAGLCFPSEDIAVLVNGAGSLYICKTFDRKEDLLWQVIHMCKPLEDNVPFQILHAACHSFENKAKLECLLVHVTTADEGDNKNYKSQFKSLIEWLSFLQVESKEGTTFKLERTRRLEGGSAPDYAIIEQNADAVCVASEKKFKMVYDSLKPLEVDQQTSSEIQSGSNDESEISKDEDNHSPLYLWTQSDEDVNLYFILPPNTIKHDIIFKLTHKHVKVSLKSGETLLNGNLSGDVDVEGSTWIVSNLEVTSDVGDFVKPDVLKLQVILSKKVSEKWSSVIQGDSKGKLVIDESQITLLQETLANFQKALNADSEEAQKPAYNIQELEDCDAFPDAQSVLLRIDGESHQVTHQVNLGSHQWLFTTPADGDKPPCLCLRHDVDGVVWQHSSKVQPKEAPWEHIATFDAFGYVQASKQQRKFTTCAPDFSYAVIADAVRHLYIYHQPTSVSSPVRNRKTGQKIDSVTKQQLVSLETVEPITGLYASNERLFVFAGNIIHVIKMKHENIL